MQLDKSVANAVKAAVQRKISDNLEAYVKKEILRELNKHGIGIRRAVRESNNRNLPLVEVRNIRNRIGTLVMDRVKDGVEEQLRFKLNGLRGRGRRNYIDEDALNAAISKAIMEHVHKAKF